MAKKHILKLDWFQKKNLIARSLLQKNLQVVKRLRLNLKQSITHQQES